MWPHARPFTAEKQPFVGYMFEQLAQVQITKIHSRRNLIWSKEN